MTREEKASYDKIYRAKKAEKIAAYKAAWYAANRDRISANEKWKYNQLTRKERDRKNSIQREMRKNNPDLFRKIAARSYIKNIEQKRAYQKKYGEMFPWKKAAIAMKRVAAKKNATPAWADAAAVDEIYRTAAGMTATTGIQHQVDHIWPLQGIGFVGLHVPWNLQVLTRTENIKKGNKRPDAYL